MKITLDLFGLQKYNLIKGYEKGGEKMVAKKRGRPTNNPKTNPIHVRLDEETLSVLDRYCKQEVISRTEGIRRGIKKLKDDIKK